MSGADGAAGQDVGVVADGPGQGHRAAVGTSGAPSLRDTVAVTRTSAVLALLAGVDAVANLIAQAVQAQGLGRVTVWLFMPLVGLWGLAAAPRPVPRPLVLLLVGTVFAWGGDVALSFGGDLLFPLGMASFLVMQVMYVLAFRAVPGPGLLRAWPVGWLPYALVWLGMNALIREGAGVLFVPVAVYSLALVVMAAQALDLLLRVPRPAGVAIAVGGGLFVISDGLIALREFAGWLPDGAGTSLAIMSTYLVAQALIVTGFVRALRST